MHVSVCTVGEDGFFLVSRALILGIVPHWSLGPKEFVFAGLRISRVQRQHVLSCSMRAAAVEGAGSSGRAILSVGFLRQLA